MIHCKFKAQQLQVYAALSAVKPGPTRIDVESESEIDWKIGSRRDEREVEVSGEESLFLFA